VLPVTLNGWPTTPLAEILGYQAYKTFKPFEAGSVTVTNVSTQLPVVGEEYTIEALIFSILVEYEIEAFVDINEQKEYLESAKKYLELQEGNTLEQRKSLEKRIVQLEKRRAELEAKRVSAEKAVVYAENAVEQLEKVFAKEPSEKTDADVQAAAQSRETARGEVSTIKAEVFDIQAEIQTVNGEIWASFKEDNAVSKEKSLLDLEIAKLGETQLNEDLKEQWVALKLQLDLPTITFYLASQPPLQKQVVFTGIVDETTIEGKVFAKKRLIIRETFNARVDMDNPVSQIQEQKIKASITVYVPVPNKETEVKEHEGPPIIEQLKIAVPQFTFQCEQVRSLAR
jgi:hypothetical protein